jgi:hypothetical protein
MSDPRLSFVENMSLAMDVLGDRYIPLGYMLSRMTYDSVEERDAVFGTARQVIGGGV